jgi:hypothetical protein
MFRVTKYSLVVLPLFALLTTAACGSKKPPAPPSMEPVDASASVDMPGDDGGVATTGDAGHSADAATGSTEPATPPATLALPTATAKITLKGKKPGVVELKSDGSVMSGGKAVAKISGMALQNADGSKPLLTVGSDGAVAADGGGAYGSFTGDELTLAKGDKVGIGDDGTITWTTGGKPAPLGKFENVAAAKRAAVLAVAFVVAPPAAEKPAAPAKPAAGEKPAKPAAPAKPKPAPKK